MGEKMTPLDNLNIRLLNAIQEQIPLVDQPFAAIAQQLGMDESEVLRRLTELKSPPKPVIRQISAIFDSRALGYQSCLVAAKVEESNLEHAVAVINAHPGVSHNYQRNHAYNLWFTLAVPPDSQLGLEKTAQILQQESRAQALRLMPSLKMYKIGVKFDLSAEAELGAREIQNPKSQIPNPKQIQNPKSKIQNIDDSDKRMIRVLQQDLPLLSRPFDEWAKSAQVTVSQLLAAAQRYIDDKRMRRFSAVLKHRQAGFSANAMGVWIVPEEKQEAFGQTAASFSAVSHCYLRPSYPDWPYNIFTMVHAPTPEECQKVLAAISQATGIKTYGSLFSSKEFKKIRVKYFTPDIEAWESAKINR
jgi:siroheme decarboxylase